MVFLHRLVSFRLPHGVAASGKSDCFHGGTVIQHECSRDQGGTSLSFHCVFWLSHQSQHIFTYCHSSGYKWHTNLSSLRRELDSTKQGFGRRWKGSFVWSSLKNIIYLREWRKEVEGNKYCMDQSWRWAMTISGIKFHLSTRARAHTHTHTHTPQQPGCSGTCVPHSVRAHTHAHSQWQGCSGTCVPPSTHTHTHIHTHILSNKDAQVPVSLTVCTHTHTHTHTPSATRMLRNLCPSQRACAHTHLWQGCSGTCVLPRVRAHTHTHTHTAQDKYAQEPVSLPVCACAHTHTHSSVTRMLRNLCPSQCVCVYTHTQSSVTRMLRKLCPSQCVHTHTHTHTHTHSSVTRMLRNLCPSQPQWSLEKGEAMGILSSFSGLRSVSAYTQLFWLPCQLAL